jgi:hypothetical protein
VFPELIRPTHCGNFPSVKFFYFYAQAIFKVRYGAPKKKRAFPFQGRPDLELEPTTPEAAAAADYEFSRLHLPARR